MAMLKTSPQAGGSAPKSLRGVLLEGVYKRFGKRGVVAVLLVDAYLKQAGAGGQRMGRSHDAVLLRAVRPG